MVFTQYSTHWSLFDPLSSLGSYTIYVLIVSDYKVLQRTFKNQGFQLWVLFGGF